MNCREKSFPQNTSIQAKPPYPNTEQIVAPVQESCRPRNVISLPVRTGSGPLAERARKTILLVSDESDLRALLRSFLEHVGFAVVSCGDLARAMQAMEAGVDLMLIDLQTLAESPWAITELTDYCEGVHVIALYAAATSETLRRECLECGWRLLPKPILLPQLLGSVHSAFDLPRSA